MYQQDKVWARYSNDKVDVGDTLTTTLRTLSKALPLEAPLTALSIGSSTEPPSSLPRAERGERERATRYPGSRVSTVDPSPCSG